MKQERQKEKKGDQGVAKKAEKEVSDLVDSLLEESLYRHDSRGVHIK